MHSGKAGGTVQSRAVGGPVSKQQGQQTSVKEFTRVKKMIEATYKTPNDLKIPCLNIEAATLELVILPTDLVAATEVVASALDRGVVRNITIIGDVAAA